jgi:hypothetical protein
MAITKEFLAKHGLVSLGPLTIKASAGSTPVSLSIDDVLKWTVNSSGHLIPGTNVDIGSLSAAVRAIYSSQLISDTLVASGISEFRANDTLNGQAVSAIFGGGLPGSQKFIQIGYNTTNDYGEIAAVHNGTVWKNLYLQRTQGLVQIGPGGLKVDGPITSQYAAGAVGHNMLAVINNTNDVGIKAGVALQTGGGWSVTMFTEQSTWWHGFGAADGTVRWGFDGTDLRNQVGGFATYEFQTDTSNFSRLHLYSSGGSYYITSEFAGTGIRRDVYLSAQNLGMTTAGILRWIFDYQGHLVPLAHLSYNIGEAGKRIANLYGGNVDLSGNVVASGSGTFSLDVQARLLSMSGFANVGAGVASTGIFFRGDGISHANIIWLPNERKFQFGTGDFATDTRDVYGSANLAWHGSGYVGGFVRIGSGAPGGSSIIDNASDVFLGKYSGGAWLNTPASTVGWLAVNNSGYINWSSSGIGIGGNPNTALQLSWDSSAGGVIQSYASKSLNLNPLGNDVRLGLSSAPVVASPGMLAVFQQYIDGANYSYTGVWHSGGVSNIGTFQGGTGVAQALHIGTTGNVPLSFFTNNILRWTVDTNGNILPVNNNTNVNGGAGFQWQSVATQAIYSYNVFTDAGNFERFEITWGANTAGIFTRAAGTGIVRDLQVGTLGTAAVKIITNGQGRWKWDSGGHYLPEANATYNIGSASARVNGLFVYTVIDMPGGAGIIQWSAAGVAPPSLSTRSAGIREVYYPAISAGSVDYARGIDGGTLWDSVPVSENVFAWYGGAARVATLTGTGNLALGLSPYSWSTNYRAIDVQSYASFWSSTSAGVSGYGTNSYISAAGGNWRYKWGGFAALYQQSANDGTHTWYSAPTGVADASIGWTNTMYLDASGNLSVTGQITINGSSGANYWHGSTYTDSVYPNLNNTYNVGAAGLQYNQIIGKETYTYNSYVDSSNWTRGQTYWSGGTWVIATAQAGTGAAAPMNIGTIGNASMSVITNNAIRWTWDTTGNVRAIGGSQVQFAIQSNVTQANISFESTYTAGTGGTNKNWAIVHSKNAYGDLTFNISASEGGNAVIGTTIMSLSNNGVAIPDGKAFSSMSGYNMVITNADGSVDHLGYHGRRALFGVNGATYIHGGDVASTIVSIFNSGGQEMPVGTATTWRNIWTDGSNNERAAAFWSGNDFYLQTLQIGTGAPRNMQIGTSGTAHLGLVTSNIQRWFISSSGHLLSTADASYDIGQSNANRVRDVNAYQSVRVNGPSAQFVVGRRDTGADSWLMYSGAGDLQFYNGGDRVRFTQNGDLTLNTDRRVYALVDPQTYGIGNYASAHLWTVSTDSATGSFGGDFIANQDVAAETGREWGVTPYNSPGIIWRVLVPDTVSSADGGWAKNVTGISAQKAYRVTTLFRRTTTSADGQFYLGCSPSDTLNLDNTPNNNPYFMVLGINIFAKDRWYLAVGYIHANGDTSTVSYGGIWDCVTGEKILSAQDFKLTSTATSQTHRSYLYYSSDGTSKIEWWQPRFEEVNGNEPSIGSLIGLVPQPKFERITVGASNFNNFLGTYTFDGTLTNGVLIQDSSAGGLPALLTVMKNSVIKVQVTENFTDLGTALRVNSPTSIWSSWASGSPTSSYMAFTRGGTSTALGYIGSDGGAILSTGTGTKFGIRSENDLLLMAHSGAFSATLGLTGLQINTTTNPNNAKLYIENATAGHTALQAMSIFSGGVAQIIIGYQDTGANYLDGDSHVIRNKSSNNVFVFDAINRLTDLFGVFTDGSNYDSIRHSFSGGIANIGTVATGTGIVRPLHIGTGGSNYLGFYTNNALRWSVGSGGSIYPNSDIAYDIGGSSNRVQNIYSQNFITHGSSSQITISRRDTNAAAWAIYSASGNLGLYDMVGGGDRFVLSPNGNTIITGSFTLSNGVWISATAGAAGTVASGVWFGGIGVAHANIGWMPNERKFILRTGNSPSDTADGYGATGLDITGDATIGGSVLRSVQTGISAAGTTQGGATLISKDISVVSTVASGSGVILPTIKVGMTLIVMNKGANALNVYPASGGAINALATNAAFSIPVSAKLMFVATTSTQWDTLNATYA